MESVFLYLITQLYFYHPHPPPPLHTMISAGHFNDEKYDLKTGFELMSQLSKWWKIPSIHRSGYCRCNRKHKYRFLAKLIKVKICIVSSFC